MPAECQVVPDVRLSFVQLFTFFRVFHPGWGVRELGGGGILVFRTAVDVGCSRYRTV